MVRRIIVTAAVALVAAPVADAAPLICLDPGHARTPNLTTEPIGPGSSIRKIKDGGGASGEAPVVLAIGLKLRSLLLDRGYRVAMTRNGRPSRSAPQRRPREVLQPPPGSPDDPHPRGRVLQPADARGVNLYPAWRRGWTSDIYRPSLRAARVVHRNVVRTTGAANRGLVARSDLTGFNWANVPVILVETGFMSNPTERRKLQSRTYQWRVARGLATHRVRPAVVTDGSRRGGVPQRDAHDVEARAGEHRAGRRPRGRRRRAPGTPGQAPLTRQKGPDRAEPPPGPRYARGAARGARREGLPVSPGQLGENVTTRGVDLLGLPAGTRLHLGETAVVELTGLRNCTQLDGIQDGLMAATLDRDEDGGLERKAGVMGIVLAGGEVRAGDPVRVELPSEPHRALEPV